jgi:hypothetical protein
MGSIPYLEPSVSSEAADSGFSLRQLIQCPIALWLRHHMGCQRTTHPYQGKRAKVISPQIQRSRRALRFPALRCDASWCVVVSEVEPNGAEPSDPEGIEYQ